MIIFNNVTKKYGKEIVLEDIKFRIQKGEFVFLTGVSGSGKTTLLKLLYKELLPTKGNIRIFEKDALKYKTKKLRRRMGIVFQNYELLQNKTVYDNVSYPLSCLGYNPFRVKKETMNALKKLNISELANKKPSELSGGQQQRVAIARAIVNKPDLLICDEPTGNLDSENTKVIMEHLMELNESGTTILMSTHSEEILKEMGKRVIKIEDGLLVSDGSYEEASIEFNVVSSVSSKTVDKTREVEILSDLSGNSNQNNKKNKKGGSKGK